MRAALFFLTTLACAQAQQPTLRIEPAVVTSCESGYGRIALAWENPGGGRVQVRIDSEGGMPMTGLEAATGRATTGDWVYNGMQFSLVDESGRRLAQAEARVSCSSLQRPIVDAFVSETYFPLRVGNTWVYRIDSRLATGQFQTWRVERTEGRANVLWFVVVQEGPGSVRTETRYRSDEMGRVYRLVELNGQEVEELWFDPSAGNVVRLPLFTSPLGQFPDAVQAQAPSGNLIMTQRVFVRGIGLVQENSTMISGSSGGFSSKLDLVEARLSGGIVLKIPSAEFEIATEKLELDVTGRNVSNCAVPCYFVACGLVPGADPPGTYRPCFFSKVRLAGYSDVTGVALALRDSTGRAVWTTTVPKPQSASEWLRFEQIPLYETPNVPYPAGTFELTAETVGGTARGRSAITLQVR